jgi:hypothetical protein
MVNRSIVLVEPSGLTFNISTNTSESCLGACDGKVFIDSLAGGVAPYAALLTNNTTALVTSHIISEYTTTILGVCSGDYTVVLTDVNDCPSSVIAGGVDHQLVGYDTITVAEIAVLTDTICHASSTGTLNVLNPNLNTGYSYSWENVNDSGVVISSAVQADNLSAGVYVLLADYNNTTGCTSTDTIEIIEYSVITNTVTIDHVDCYEQSTGSILASASGTVPPYSYTWSSGQTTALASNLTVGTYVLTIEDANDCENEFSYSINESDQIDVDVDVVSYTLSATVLSGGLEPYTYEWFESSNISYVLSSALSYTVSANGSYYVNVTDAYGCVQSSSITPFGITLVLDLSAISLSIYPNPFKDETTVDFGREVKQASVRVVDVFGKLIEEHSIINTDKHILKRENKASGIYFVEIEVEQKEKMIYKLIIE